jgi:Mg2+ and Co2+ transporter CorA
MDNQINGTPKATFYLNELASEMTALFIEMKYDGQDVQMYDVEEEELRYTEKIQDEFNQMYDVIETYLSSNQIK